MSENVSRDDLVRADEVAARLGVTPSAVANWRTRYPNFPQAIAADANGRGGVLVWSEVEAWNQLRETGVQTIGTRLEFYRATVSRSRTIQRMAEEVRALLAVAS